MVFLGEALFLVELCLLVYCVLSIVTTPEAQVRNLPKLVWLPLVVLLPLAGGIAWLVAGRPAGTGRLAAARGLAGRVRPSGTLPAPQRPRGGPVGGGPDDDEAFLRQLRERAEEQRRQARRDQPGPDQPPT